MSKVIFIGNNKISITSLSGVKDKIAVFSADSYNFQLDSFDILNIIEELFDKLSTIQKENMLIYLRNHNHGLNPILKCRQCCVYCQNNECGMCPEHGEFHSGTNKKCGCGGKSIE